MIRLPPFRGWAAAGLAVGAPAADVAGAPGAAVLAAGATGATGAQAARRLEAMTPPANASAPFNSARRGSSFSLFGCSMLTPHLEAALQSGRPIVAPPGGRPQTRPRHLHRA